MAFLKRILLLFFVNLCVVLTVSLVTGWLGLDVYMTSHGMNYQHLAVFCLIWGMASALISLALSRKMAQWMMGVHIINPLQATNAEKKLLSDVHYLARRAGMSDMPQVGIFHSSSPNAFATGPTAKRSLVAVSDSLLSALSEDEVQAVLGHEITHITNGDMITMTVLQGLINGFVMFLARAAAFICSRALSSGRSRNSRDASPFVYYGLVFLFEILFMMIGMLIIAAFSRRREYRADAGGAGLTSRLAMVGALKALDSHAQAVRASGGYETLQIQGKRSRWLSLLATHPPLEDRIAHLELAAQSLKA